MSTSQEASTAAIANSSDRQPGPAASTVVVISSNKPAENLITSLKGDSNTSESAPENQEVDDASELTREQWKKIITSSAIFKAFKGQSEGGRLHINRAPCADNLQLIAVAVALKNSGIEDEETENGFPEFEIADDTYVETRESKNRLEREMTLKAFTESGIHAALSGGTPDIGLGLSSSVSYQTEQNSSMADQQFTTSIHAFYNIPRVIVHLHPDSLTLSKRCKNFFSKYGQENLTEPELDNMLSRFYNRFGAILPRRVTLGGRLCTSQEIKKEDETRILDLKKNLRSELTATVKGGAAGLDSGLSGQKGKARDERQSRHEEYSRMTLETQGGNGLLASSIPSWINSVASHRYWRPIQQDQPEDLLTFLTEISDGSAVHDQIKNLTRHANHIGGKRLLEVSVDAQFVSRELIRDFHRFYSAVELHVSRPTAISGLKICRHPDFGPDPSLHEIKREYINQQMKIEIDLPDSFSPISNNSRLPKEVSLEFHITLEPYLSWVDESNSFLSDSDSPKTVVLALPDVEVNSKKRWNLPYVHANPRRLRDMFPPNAISVPTLDNLAESQSDKIPSRERTPAETTKHVSNTKKWVGNLMP